MEREIEVLKEKLRIQTEYLRNLTILLITVGGGTASLTFRLKEPVAVPLFFIGLIFTLTKELDKWTKPS